MTRWRVTQLDPSGQPLRFYTDRLVDAQDLVYRLGGRWLLERQFRWRGNAWRNDRGRRPVFELEYHER